MLRATLTSNLIGIPATTGGEEHHLIPKILHCGLILVLVGMEQVFVSSATEMARSFNSLPSESGPMRGMRAIALLIGLLCLVISSLLFWSIFAVEGSWRLSAKGVAFLLGVSVCIHVSTFLCLWGANKQSVINYLRLLGLPPAVLAAMQFDHGPAFGLFYIAASFLAIVIFWNLALSGVQRLMKDRTQGFDPSSD